MSRTSLPAETGPNAGRPSLLRQHTQLLGYGGGRADDPALVDERTRLGQARLAPLVLPTAAEAAPSRAAAARRPAWILDRLRALVLPLASGQGPRLVGAAVCGAALTMATYRLLAPTREPGGKLRFKGASHVWVYWERDGEVQPWSIDAALRNGDRVRAEVLASSDAVAFLAVESRDKLLLSDPAKVAASALSLAAGEQRIFPGSFKLVGRDDGETLLVVICNQVDAGPKDALIAALLPGQGRPVERTALPVGCGISEFPLRGGDSANQP